MDIVYTCIKVGNVVVPSCSEITIQGSVPKNKMLYNSCKHAVLISLLGWGSLPNGYHLV